jgi:phage shock protein PspC (stress-responsive transcriptional regulator)
MSSSESERDQGAPRPPRLVRTRRGRLVGGVCSGLGAHFGVDPILIRIAFVGLAIFAGVGFWLYLAILLLVPEEGARRAPISLRGISWRSAVGVAGLLAAAAIAASLAARSSLSVGAWVAVGLGAIALVGALAAWVWTRGSGRAAIAGSCARSL